MGPQSKDNLGAGWMKEEFDLLERAIRGSRPTDG
jgi:hypothetical protein